MTDDKPKIGSIVWQDLTVENTENLRDCYSQVVGWTSSPVGMGEYDDFNMTGPGSDQAAAGICHARGSNVNLPPQWLIYISVENVEASARRCVELGGKVID